MIRSTVFVNASIGVHVRAHHFTPFRDAFQLDLNRSLGALSPTKCTFWRLPHAARERPFQPSAYRCSSPVDESSRPSLCPVQIRFGTSIVKRWIRAFPRLHLVQNRASVGLTFPNLSSPSPATRRLSPTRHSLPAPFVASSRRNPRILCRINDITIAFVPAG